MKSFDSNLPRLLAASAFALTCFCVGYLTPHPIAALGQAPHPTASFIDDVPGGGHLSHGIATVTDAAVTQSAMMTASKSGWACAKQNKCEVIFEFRSTPQGSSAPKAFKCPSSKNCFAFAGGGFTYSKENPYTGAPGQTYNNVQIAGMFQLQAK